MSINGHPVSETPLQADEKGRLVFHPSLVEQPGKVLRIKVVFWNEQYPKTAHSEVPEFTWLTGKKIVRLRAYNIYEMTPRSIPNENNEPTTYKRPYHLVKPGDTWERIEKETGINQYVIIWENGLDEATPLSTLVGKKLYFPRGSRKGHAKSEDRNKKTDINKKEGNNVLPVRSENNGKPLDIVSQNADKCLCHRDFTVDEFKLIIQKLHKSKVIPNLWIPSLKTGAAPNDKSYESSVKELNRILEKYEINSCLRKLHFLAQVFHETHGFRSAQEYGKTLSYDPYRGRGLIHLTHRFNYKSFSNYVNDEAIMINPHLVATKIEYVFESGGWYWRKGSAWGDLNKWADKDDLYYLNIGVNGGFIGFKERIEYVHTLIKLLHIKECSQVGKNGNLGIYSYSSSDIRNTKYGKRNEQKFKKFDMP
ncbi:hypothetical protein [Rodentibacter sp. Ppn85]|uniref:hypothetical protein n=1 Tax=Rodentibacter sp. Ppn85 TaxID=1908525 RepID=UPI000986EA94|nr:hypothetical protein [Rodentibacter sp. Ppn85]OOF63364.1 hypothetical protein BKL51_08650 [Rodentibacter sp. Ppn85]